MSDAPSPDNSPGPESDGRIPRLAIGVVILGVIASLAIYGISFLPGSGSLEIDWDTSEELASPPTKQVGTGTFSVGRASLSAIAPNEDGLLLYRVAGAVRVESGGRKPTRVRCDIRSGVNGDTRLARSGGLRAAWPRSSSDLDVKRQDVPEVSSVKYRSDDSKKIELPIRDVVRRYSDIDSAVVVEWEGYVEDKQTWIWNMADGTGAGSATLPWLVIFESEDRPRGTIICSADIDGQSKRIVVPFLQEEWPIIDDEPNADGSGDADTGDVPNVE